MKMLTLYFIGQAVWIVVVTPLLYKNLELAITEPFDAEGFFVSALLALFTSVLWPALAPPIGLAWLGMRLAGYSTNQKKE